MQESGLTWDQATLDRYLAAPQDGPVRLEREGLIAVIDYLKSIG